MSIKGITLKATFDGPVQFEDDWIDRMYRSLEQNMAIVSCDLQFDEERATISSTLGVEAPRGLDADSLVEGIARDALDKAIDAANGEDGDRQSDRPIVQNSPVLVFA